MRAIVYLKLIQSACGESHMYRQAEWCVLCEMGYNVKNVLIKYKKKNYKNKKKTFFIALLYKSILFLLF